MNIYRKDELVSLMEQLDFQLTHQEEHYDYALEPTLDCGIIILRNYLRKKKQDIKTLEASTRFLKRNIDEVLRTVGLSTFVFEKC